MTGLELIKKLKDSGTGESKLEQLQEFVEAKTNATAEDVVLHAASIGVPGGFGRATLDKAIQFAGLSEKYQLADGPPELPPALRLAQGIKTIRADRK